MKSVDEGCWLTDKRGVVWFHVTELICVVRGNESYQASQVINIMKNSCPVSVMTLEKLPLLVIPPSFAS